MLVRSALAGAWLLTLLVLGCASPEPVQQPAPATTPEETSTPPEPMSDAFPSRDAASTEQPPQDPRTVMETAFLAFSGNPVGVRTMGESGDQSYVPVLVEFLRFPWRLDSRSQSAVYTSLARLIDQENEGLSNQQKVWDWWVHWLGNRPEVEPPPGFAAWKGQLFARLVDPEMGAFLYEGVPARIRLEEIVWGGVVKDGIPDLTNPRIISAEEATYLEPSERVFGVSFNGEHRAYPHRILNPHEMANDVVGGVPFALAY